MTIPGIAALVAIPDTSLRGRFMGWRFSNSLTKFRTLSFLSVVLVVFPVSASAQTATNPSDPTTIADASIAASPLTPDADPAAPPEAPVKKKKKGKKDGGQFTFANHPSFRIGSTFRIDFEARVESDTRTPTNAIGLDNTQTDMAKPRLGVSGSLFDKLIGFEVSRDPAEGPGELKDAYVKFRPWRAFELEGGRFKLPFGLEMLTGRTSLDFVNRSFAASTLSPSRDVGVMAHGRLRRGIVEYQAGYFTRDGDNARTSQTRGAGSTLAARVVVTPFASRSDSRLAPLQIGAAATMSRLDNQLGLRGETVFGDGVFFDRVYVNGRRERTGLEALWQSGPASISSELVVVSDQRKGMGLEGENLPGVTARSWYVAGTWALTGEAKQGRLEPAHRFLQGGVGALELAARLEQLRFGDLIYPGTSFGFPTPSSLNGNADLAATVGVNWYLNRYVKVQPNLVIESIRDPERSPAPGASGRFISGVVRVQFAL
jgi:phosphate-selective porin OprO and OprP